MPRLRITPLIDALLYSHVWIGLCALAMVWQTNIIVGPHFSMTSYQAVVFFGTISLYSIHRLIGLRRLGSGMKIEGRFGMVFQFRKTGLFLAISGGLLSVVFFLRLGASEQKFLVLPAVVALLYALPVFPKGNRLRDFPFIKVFLISVVWAWLTALVPAGKVLSFQDPSVWLLSAERGLFILGITIPFDIRDYHTDKVAGVDTLPAVIGPYRARYLSAFCLCFAGVVAFFNPLYSSAQWAALIISLLPALIIVKYSTPNRHDYFYTGLADGLMIVQAGLLWIASGGISQF